MVVVVCLVKQLVPVGGGSSYMELPVIVSTVSESRLCSLIVVVVVVAVVVVVYLVVINSPSGSMLFSS